MITNFRALFARLAESLIEQGREDSARRVLRKCLELFPDSLFPHDFFSVQLFEQLIKTADFENAYELARQLLHNTSIEARFYLAYSKEGKLAEVSSELLRTQFALASLAETLQTNARLLQSLPIGPRYKELADTAKAVLKELQDQANIILPEEERAQEE